MMNKLDALQLAVELDSFSNPWDKQAADELRRLRAQRDALLEALKAMLVEKPIDELLAYAEECKKQARAAIKAVEENA